jgi:hypothetical protein
VSRLTGLMAFFLCLVALVALPACSTESECSDEVACPFGEVCIGGSCQSGSCSTSSDCPIEHFCKNRTCTAGCESSRDCVPGNACNDKGECVAEPCKDTHTDCGFREYCDVQSGECYDAGRQYCKPCDRDNSEADCGEGNVCFANYCGVNCSEDRSCPSGFQCYPLENSDGAIETWQCITYCWLYEDYEPGAAAKAPPDGLTISVSDDTCSTHPAFQLAAP